jgi:aminoglycoside phosphotransferase (APT) family kinase protein
VPIPEQRDLAQARRQLQSWLEAKLPDASGVELSELSAPAFTGFSNETLLFDAGWTTGGAGHREPLVARVLPTAHAVFLEQNFDLQYRVMSALGAATDVPVPRMFWLETDESILGSPFYVMERVDGEVPGDNPPYTTQGWLYDSTPGDQERLWWSGIDRMADIHNLDWKSLGLEFLEAPGVGTAGLDDQLEYYDRYFTWAARGEPNPVVEAALAWVQANRPASDEPKALCWGDARIGNMIFSDYTCAAVLDWEMVTLGDPVQDLGWWLFLDRHHAEGTGVPRLPGFPSHEETVARWETRTRRSAQDLEFYEVFAALRFAVVMIRIATLIVQFELMPPGIDLATNNAVTRLLAKMLHLPAPDAQA